MVSIIGLIVIQYNYLKIGLNLAQVRFNQNIGKTIKTIKSDLADNNKLTFLLGKAITNDDTYFDTELDSLKNASIYFLHSFLEDRLLENGIKTDFSYKLYVRESELKLQSKSYKENDAKLKKYTIDLFGYLPNLADKNVGLELQFNKINEYFLFQLNSLNIPSFIFLVSIIFMVAWVLKSLYWHQGIITMTNDFINNLTHELKTPVFSIGLATKMLQQQENEKNKIYIEIIRNQNNRLKEHIDKVLQLSSLDKKSNALQFTKTAFTPHLKKLCEEFSAISKMEDVTFTYQITDKPYTLNCELMHLINAINNLLDNAKKYKSASSKIVLQSEQKNNKLHISIKDNGIGIHKKDQQNIFKKHFRVSSGDLYTVKGYGLGLNYVKKIVTLHKGTIDLESELQKGTTITIKLPLVKT
ncbi:two-component system, OmpR family, phosphate regulon sensor histidine kinase PhoR [Lutibacter flavus]|uniref:histidine kinase n=2 Tax=Lutibacter flavus TaxID=691689 RepID=A0A238XAM1_9FLAO|nr:two-component system, OmpR family, phosphate regulon sensor histidine kinase PhoR [Lutibacter flavus]